MMKEVVRALDSGLLPIIGLIAFAVAFTAIVLWAITMKKEDRDAAKQQPLQEPARTVDLPLN
ncbi:MAG: hypothetical protein AAF564_11010 [Bacteroidota bacterium]